MVNDHNVKRKHHGATQHRRIAHGQAECLIGKAQEIQPHARQRHTDPQNGPGLLFQKDAQHRHQNHIYCRKKARFARCGIGNARLLYVRARKHQHAAARAAQQQGAPGRGRHIAPHAVDGQRRQQQRPQQHARTIEKGRANQICPGALRHKRRPPYHGRQQKQKIAPRFSCLHTISSFALLFCHTQKMQKLKLHKK